MRNLNIRSVVMLLGLVGTAMMGGLSHAFRPGSRRSRAAIYGRVLPDMPMPPRPKPARKRNPDKLARRLMKASVW